MSCTIREYEPVVSTGPASTSMSLTAFVGGEEHPGCIQFTIGSAYCQLDERALLDMIRVISARLMGKKGYRATEGERKKLLYEGDRDAKVFPG